MSFYRTVLAAVAAVALASPVFADDTTANTANAPAAQTDSSATQAASSDQASMDSKVNVNKASAKELMKVKGINASKARAIVAYRKKHGNFTSTDDLAKIKGFKKMKPEMMKEVQDQLSAE